MKIYQFLESLTAPLDEFLLDAAAALRFLATVPVLSVFDDAAALRFLATVPVLSVFDDAAALRFLATVPVLFVFDDAAALRFLATVPVLVPVLLDVSFLIAIIKGVLLFIYFNV